MVPYISPLKKAVIVVRIVSFVVIEIFILLLLVGLDRNTGKLYLHKLEFSHLDVAKGLYNALSSNANTLSNTDNPYGPGLTTLEIEILVEYTSDEFASTPQFLVSGISRYCYGTFDSVSLSNDNINDANAVGAGEVKSQNVTVFQCVSLPGYYLNYRSLLGQVGLTIILEYAYNGDYSETASYQRLMQSVARVMHFFPNCLYFVSACQLFVFFVSLVIACVAAKDRRSRKNQLTLFLVHFCALLTSASIIAVMVAVLAVAIISFELRSRVLSELGDYGISLSLGGGFFGVAWVLFLFSFLNFCAWGGVAWCTVPDDDFESDERFYRASHRKSLQSLSAFTGTALSNSSPQFPNLLHSNNTNLLHSNNTNLLHSNNLNFPPASYENELRNGMTFVGRSNTGMSSTLYSTRTSSRRFKPFTLSNANTLPEDMSRAGFQGDKTFAGKIRPLGDNNSPFENSPAENTTPGTITTYPDNQSRFLSIHNTRADSNPQSQLHKAHSNSDLISMVSENDIYANDIDYNQILQSSDQMRTLNYSGFGLRKNGTIKDNIFRADTGYDQNAAGSSQNGGSASGSRNRDIEQEFFTVQKYGYEK